MSLNDDLKDIELKLRKNAYMSFHNDGIIDILMGWNLMGIGLFLYTHSMLFSFIGLAPLLLLTPLKTRITLPRLGHARFRTRRTPPMWVAGSIGALLLIAAVIYGIFLKNILGLVGAIALIVFGLAFVMVLVSGFNRIFAYALFIPLFFVVGLGLGFLSPVMTIGVGAVVMTIGIWMLVNFIRHNPVINTEEELVPDQS